MPPPPLPPEMASAVATRFAAHWIVDDLAGDDSSDFSVLQALLGASPEALTGAPEATRERLALRTLQELSSLIPSAGGDAAATAGALRVDGAVSCEDALYRLFREVEISGKLEKDLLRPFSQDIQEIISTKKVTLPETSFQLLKGVGLWILHQPCTPESRSYVPPQEDTTDAVGLGARSPGSISEPFSQHDKYDRTAAVEPKPCRQKSPNLPHCADGEGADDGGSSNQSSKVSSHEGLSAHATVTPGFDRISDVLPTDASEPGHLSECITTQDTTMIPQPDSRKAHLSALQQERGEKVNQNLEVVSASIRPVEKDHAHGDLTLKSASALLSISCNGANQGSKSTNLQPGTAATEDRMAFEELNADTSPLEVSGANKANQALHDDGSMMKNNTVHGGLTVQTAPVSQNCNVTLHDKTSEANCFCEQKNEKNRTDVQKDNCRTSIASSSKDRDNKSAKKTSNEENSKDPSPEIGVHSKDQCIDDILEDLSQQGLCIKCLKDGELLTCSDCSLAAHDSCFGPSVTFEWTDLFYCPLCSYKKAKEDCLKKKETYLEAMENLRAYLGTAQVSKQHDLQLNGVEPGAAKRDGHPNGSVMSKGNRIHQNEAYDPAHRDEEPHQPKKQKISAQEVLNEKDPFQNSGPASMNKLPVPQNNSMTQVKGPEKKQQAGDKEAGNPPSDQDVEAVLNEKDPFQNSGPASMNKHSVLQNNSKTQVKDPEKKQQSAEKEACKEAGNHPSNPDVEADQEDSLTAPNQSCGKRSSPFWRNVRHEKESANKSRKGTAKQDQPPTSRRKRGSVQPQKRYSNPVAPPGRRPRKAWTGAEEAMLKDAMAKFYPQGVGDAEISWIRILAYGSHVFDKKRLPPDLRTKWRNMMAKASNLT